MTCLTQTRRWRRWKRRTMGRGSPTSCAGGGGATTREMLLQTLTGTQRLVAAPASSAPRWAGGQSPASPSPRTACRRRQIESNARMVEWEDGSLQLLVGQHAFRLDPQPRREGCVVVAASHRSHGETVLESHGQTTHRFRITAGSCVPCPRALPSPSSFLCGGMTAPRGTPTPGCARLRRWCGREHSGRSASVGAASRSCTTPSQTRVMRRDI